MRRSTGYIIITVAALLLVSLLPLHAARAQRLQPAHPLQLRNLRVTDICLATEARYTRHPALADRHAAFQDHPLSLEHFPSGSLILPPVSERDGR